MNAAKNVIEITVCRIEGEWFYAWWINGEYDGNDSLGIDDDASTAEAIEAAMTMLPNVDGERVVRRVKDVERSGDI